MNGSCAACGGSPGNWTCAGARQPCVPTRPPSLYPPGYRDPEWDGTEAGFRDVVLPARIKALTQGLNERYKDVLPEGMRFEWSAEPLLPGEAG